MSMTSGTFGLHQARSTDLSTSHQSPPFTEGVDLRGTSHHFRQMPP